MWYEATREICRHRRVLIFWASVPLATPAGPINAPPSPDLTPTTVTTPRRTLEQEAPVGFYIRPVQFFVMHFLRSGAFAKLRAWQR